MKNVIFATAAVLALAFICFVPMIAEGSDASGSIYHDGTNVFKVSSSQSFDIVYDLEESVTADITYTAKVVDSKGNTVSGAVTPSTGSLTTKVHKTLTVTSPSTAGNYTLEVKFTLTDSEKKTTDSTQKYSFVSVNPITLTVNLQAEKVTINMDDFGVFFVVDGERLSDSYSTVTLDKNGKGTISYSWIANPSKGAHTFYVESSDNVEVIKGLGEKHTFYIGDNDYTAMIVFMILVVLILIIVAIMVYRKPIKNFGKPKSRR